MISSGSGSTLVRPFIHLRHHSTSATCSSRKSYRLLAFSSLSITFVIISTQMTYSYVYNFMSLSSVDFSDLSAMEICAVDVSRWFVENALLLNPDKTEAVVFGTRKRLPQLHLSRGIDVPLGRALTSPNPSSCSVWFSMPV